MYALCRISNVLFGIPLFIIEALMLNQHTSINMPEVHFERMNITMQTLVDNDDIIQAKLGNTRVKVFPAHTPRQSAIFLEGALQQFSKVSTTDLSRYLEYKTVEEHNPGSKTRQSEDNLTSSTRVAALGKFMLSAEVVRRWGNFSTSHVGARVASRLFRDRTGRLLVVARYQTSVRDIERPILRWLSSEDLEELFESDPFLLSAMVKELKVTVAHAKALAQARVDSLGSLEGKFAELGDILHMTEK